ncbi:unnamed protein product [Triticum turgidum subsp. durum]|uniref:J domain-containing protein n=1 Tax=Triticum turgidum subsp. durum TaxID=4567 RepID=A0A9R0S1K2_TRITD|nr:unnamed protein product [Triticum turgidum subsp. durum]
MECNKDEALRAKQIAERKFESKDLQGAKKFALKAKSLFPDLEGIMQMIITFDVYLTSELKVAGENDYYSILSVDTSADDETVKKQYRKMALLLHPDKNKSVGAEGAFQLVKEAWTVLSDKTKRLLYDQKRKVVVLQQKTAQSNRTSATQGATNGFENFAAKSPAFKPRANKPKTGSTTSAARQRPPPPPQRPPPHHQAPPPTYEKVKRDREEAQAVARREEAFQRKHNPLKSKKYVEVSKATVDSTAKKDVCVDPEENGSANSNGSADSTAAGNEDEDPMSYTVPDPDFHDFDKDRIEECFQSDQIWASYDDDDGMPRFYTFIQKVISLNPFKVKISYLESKTNSEFGPLSWVSSGFAKTCGDFRIAKHEICDVVNMFSHQIKWEKGPRGVVKVYPREGDIWALYRNWSSEWDGDTPDNVLHVYDLVEVLDDYDEDHGISVIPLVKVTGFRTVFQRHQNKNVIKRIPKEEMFRFSHQVPFYRLSGEEAPNVPKDSYEVDPAAIPKELLQGITETAEEAEGTSKSS